MLDVHLTGTDALVALDAAHDAAWRIDDRDLLELCRRRIAMLRRHEPTLSALSASERDQLARWPSNERFGDLERSALAFTEQWMMDVSSITDDQAASLRRHIGDQRFADFVTALLIVEQRMSLELILDRVL